MAILDAVTLISTTWDAVLNIWQNKKKKINKIYLLEQVYT